MILKGGKTFEILLILTEFANVMTHGVVKVCEMCKPVGKLNLTPVAVGGMIHNFHNQVKQRLIPDQTKRPHVSQGQIAISD
jgi:hypothetical protein